MVSKGPAIPRQELRDTDGHTFAYIVSAEEMQRLLAEAEELRRQIAVLQGQKSYYVRELEQVLRTFIPIPPTRGEMEAAAANDNSPVIDAIVAGLHPPARGPE
jgi:hypothetical protein